MFISLGHGPEGLGYRGDACKVCTRLVYDDCSDLGWGHVALIIRFCKSVLI